MIYGLEKSNYPFSWTKMSKKTIKSPDTVMKTAYAKNAGVN